MGKEYELQDSYPVVCGRRTICFCGKAIMKGQEVLRGVYMPSDGSYGMVWRLGHNKDCLPKYYVSGSERGEST